jgi:uncharacterized protein (DUF1501 family)
MKVFLTWSESGILNARTVKMLRLGYIAERNCQGMRRREFLQVGGVGFLGLGLADVLGARPASNSARNERNCIFIYLAGGPSQLETFDPKPLAPLGVRSAWGAIPTVVPGTHISELLPKLAAQADRYALVRTLHHTNGLHNPWPMLTGNMQSRTTHGAAVTYLRRARNGEMPPYVHIGAKLSVGGGALGGNYNPLEIASPLAAEEALARFTLAADVPPERLLGRKGLLHDMDQVRRAADSIPAEGRDAAYQRAYNVLTSTRVRDAFDLSRETESRRDRFGSNCFGQSCLLARRLVQAGTRFVQVAWYDREDGFAVGWDVHGDDFNGLVRMEQQLCPRLDQGLSALLDDLREHGMLEDTLVCVTGEFGRTPKMTRHGGRDHWPYCFSALLAGAGVPGGAVVGASDGSAAYPVNRPVSAPDFAATLYRLLGVDAASDERTLPTVLEGHPIDELCRG